MLVVDSDYFEVMKAESGDFHARMTVREKSSNNKWNLATVYGAAHARDKEAFLVELVHIFDCNELPLLVGGDFNLIRKISDSSRARRLNKWSNFFNTIIEHWEFKEVEIAGGCFTWRNNHSSPLFKILDKIIMDNG